MRTPQYPGSALQFLCHLVLSSTKWGCWIYPKECRCLPSRENYCLSGIGWGWGLGWAFCWWGMLTHQESPAVNTLERDYVSLFLPPKDIALPWASPTMSWCEACLTHPVKHHPGRFRCVLVSVRSSVFQPLGQGIDSINRTGGRRGVMVKNYTEFVPFLSAAILNPCCSHSIRPISGTLGWECHLFTRKQKLLSIISSSSFTLPSSPVTPLASSCL